MSQAYEDYAPPAHDVNSPACGPWCYAPERKSIPKHRQETLVAHRTHPGRCRVCCEVIRNKDGKVSRRQWHQECWERYALRSGNMQYVRQFVWKRDNGVCATCGRQHTEWGGWEADHIVPLSDGGGFDLDNLQTLCSLPCHRDKTVAEARKRSQARAKAAAEGAGQLSILQIQP